MRRMMLLAAAVLVATAGCSGGKPTTTKELTQRQRDSVLSRSVLPGADVVGHAMNATDREAARAGSLNAQVDSLPR